jgi:DNA-binding IclR family transcriptional regulator
VGKLLLAYALPDDEAVHAWVGERRLERRTGRTLTTAHALAGGLREIRDHGYATDDQENEDGINCLAVPAFLGSPSTPCGAVSISAPAYRTPLRDLVAEITAIRATVAA